MFVSTLWLDVVIKILILIACVGGVMGGGALIAWLMLKD